MSTRKAPKYLSADERLLKIAAVIEAADRRCPEHVHLSAADTLVVYLLAVAVPERFHLKEMAGA